MEKLPGVLRNSQPSDEELGQSGTHQYRSTSDKYGVIDIGAEKFRRIKLEEYTDSSEVRVKRLGRGG